MDSRCAAAVSTILDEVHQVNLCTHPRGFDGERLSGSGSGEELQRKKELDL